MVRATMFASVFAVMALAAPSWADDDCGGCKEKVSCEKPCKPCKVPKVDADIEKLKVTRGKCSNDICIEYQADIDHPGCTQYDLVIQLKDKCGKVVWETVVQLDEAYKVDHKHCQHFHYKGTFAGKLPESCCEQLGKLKAEGNIVARGTNCSSDRERERVHSSSKI